MPSGTSGGSTITTSSSAAAEANAPDAASVMMPQKPFLSLGQQRRLRAAAPKVKGMGRTPRDLGPATLAAVTDKQLAHCQVGSIDEFAARLAQRQADRAALNAAVMDPAVAGEQKQHLRCEYILKYGKTLFSCPRCWLLPGLCVCSRMQVFEPRTKAVVHVHHNEWGRSSNTGAIIALSLKGSEMLIKGHKEHDDRLQELFQDSTYTTAVLWPGDTSITPSELKAIAAERSGGRIAVVAVDATWRNAMRMKTSYPDDALHVKLTAESALPADRTKSLLAPVRKYRGDLATNGRVSTLEAMAALLRELEEPAEEAERIQQGMLTNCKIKVDGCLTQKSRESEYGMVDEEDLMPDFVDNMRKVKEVKAKARKERLAATAAAWEAKRAAGCGDEGGAAGSDAEATGSEEEGGEEGQEEAEAEGRRGEGQTGAGGTGEGSKMLEGVAALSLAEAVPLPTR